MLKIVHRGRDFKSSWEYAHKKEDWDKHCECSICSKLFKEEGTSKSHKKIHTEGKFETYMACGKLLRDKCTLETHWEESSDLWEIP